jgi:cytochrome c-type biogenesis protein CcmE
MTHVPALRSEVQRRRPRRVGPIGWLLALGAITFLAFLALARSPTRGPYFRVEELMAAPEAWNNKEVRVHGRVQPGSIHVLPSDDGEPDYSLMMTSKTKRIRVLGAGRLPATLRDDSEVVVVGRLELVGRSWVLASTELITKCGGKYDETSTDRRGPPRYE